MFSLSKELHECHLLGPTISARTVFNEVKKYEVRHKANESTYWLVFELLWRDYFKYFSKKYGSKIYLLKGVQSVLTKTPVKNRKAFQDWCEGRTASDFVNANMRELNLTGWMLYLSGQGSDPRSRVFNTARQADMYDPQGLYQNKWLVD